MALDGEDPRSGFRHRDVVTFINQEVLSNGGGPDFYMTYRSRPWNEIEDELQSVLADIHVPLNLKRACAWSALALSVRVATRQREQQARRVQRLQEQVEERETATWALASQLQRLREERKQVVMQLRRTRQDLQQALSEREALRGQLLQAQRAVSSRSPQLRADTWPVTAEERNKLLVATSQRRRLEAQREEAQYALAGGVQYVQGAQGPWAQVAQPPAPMPCPRHMPYPMPFPYPPPPPPRVLSEAEGAAATAAAYPAPQMPAPVMCAPAMWPVVVSQEEVALPWYQRVEGQGEGPHFGNPVGHFQVDPMYQQSQDRMPRTPDGSSSEAEGSPAPYV
ncbi:protein ATP1B4 isoform X6 [Bos javanicus]|uniref:protein ATP1B4 isoform X6 n=1 Tax=Bos javanicus TaxID=9906 RepID=UPI002AA8319F|nr:protein ATP1B4 isoform X6 [Bos javanicus]